MGSKELTRGAGVLLAITSLPSSYRIGTLGEAAFQFVDLLVDLKQRYWQVLPINPTSFGNSPYQSYSAFAGNPYLIDLDDLIRAAYASITDNKYAIRCISILYRSLILKKGRRQIQKAKGMKLLHCL